MASRIWPGVCPFCEICPEREVGDNTGQGVEAEMYGTYPLLFKFTYFSGNIYLIIYFHQVHGFVFKTYSLNIFLYLYHLVSYVQFELLLCLFVQ